MWYCPYLDGYPGGPNVPPRLNPAFRQPNVVLDFHLYTGVGQLWVDGMIKNAVYLRNMYNVPVWCGDINVQGRGGPTKALTEYEIKAVNSVGIAWTTIIYTTYAGLWDPVLQSFF
jgi:hypothetical protein